MRLQVLRHHVRGRGVDQVAHQGHGLEQGLDLPAVFRAIDAQPAGRIVAFSIPGVAVCPHPPPEQVRVGVRRTLGVCEVIVTRRQAARAVAQ